LRIAWAMLRASFKIHPEINVTDQLESA